MGSHHILFGRNVLKEAIAVNAAIDEIFYENDSSKNFILETLGAARARTPLKKDLPREVRDAGHQGVAFRVKHDFYLNKWEPSPEKQPLVLLCNHLEDVQNLGAVTRSAAAFGVSLIVHEDARSAQLTPTAIKVSAGQAFRLKFLRVSNLLSVCQDLEKAGYFLAGLDADESAQDVWAWKPAFPLALVLGSEEKGISKPVKNRLNEVIRIPMTSGVESLNASNAAAVVLGKVYSQFTRERGLA